MPETAANKNTVSTVERALDMLAYFTASDRADLGVTEISNALGLSKAVVHRLLTTLVSRGFVAADERTRRYRLGPAALALGAAYRERVDVRSLAQPWLKSLSRSTNETATLSLRQGNTRFYIDQVTPPREVKMTVAIGEAFPLHAGGSSKAFLAFLPAAEREAYLGSGRLTQLTDATVVDVDALRSELDAIRSRGWAHSCGERQSGAASVAAPIFDQTNDPIAVISVCGPAERFVEVTDAVVTDLLAATTAVSRDLGHRSGARP